MAQEVAPLKSWSYFERSLTRNEFFLRGSERRDASSFRFACPHRSRACARVKRFSVKIKSEGRYGFSSRHSASRGVKRPRGSPISREKIHGCCIIHKERHLVAFFFFFFFFFPRAANLYKTFRQFVNHPNLFGFGRIGTDLKHKMARDIEERSLRIVHFERNKPALKVIGKNTTWPSISRCRESEPQIGLPEAQLVFVVSHANIPQNPSRWPAGKRWR